MLAPRRPLRTIFCTLGLCLVAGLFPTGCTEALYPPRPPQLPGPALADPQPSRVTLHISVTEQGLSQLLESTVPKTGELDYTLLGPRKLTWERGAFALRFDGAQGKLGVQASVTAQTSLAVGKKTFSLKLGIEAQPVVSSDYLAQLQSPVVTVTSEDAMLRAAEWGGGVLSDLKKEVEQRVLALRIDLKPMLAQGYGKLAQPFPFQVGDASACGRLGLSSVEAGPTVLAGGIEKDLGIVVAPSVTLPCSTERGMAKGQATLPPLHNVASIPSGPFSVTVPVAATYAELQKAMKQTFTNGKLFFSADYPELYLEKPEVYASGGQIVLKLHLNGYVKKGLRLHLEGDLYMAGHPEVRDNQLGVPDLAPTIETKNALLRLKTSLDGESIRVQARNALRLDIGARIQTVREKFEKDLLVRQRISNGPEACIQTNLGRVEVSDVFAHDAYLRLYVKATATAAAYLPCPS